MKIVVLYINSALRCVKPVRVRAQLSVARTAAIWSDFAYSFSDAVLAKCHYGGSKNICTPKTPPRLERLIAKKRQVLSPTTFAARFANPVALGALKLRPDLNQRSATGRTGRLALLFDLLSFRFPNVCASRVLILELHLFRPLLW